MAPKTPYAPIIYAAADIPILVRIRDILLTAALWIAYFYFVRDFLWFLKDVAVWTSHGFSDTAGYSSFRVLPTILNYLIVAFLLGAVYILWAKYNQLRFRGKNRRQAALPVTTEQLAVLYNVDAASVKKWQSAETLTMHHDVHGYLTKVEIN